MNDPHIESLTYTLKANPSVSYNVSEPLVFETAAFQGVLDSGKLILRPKEHYPTAVAAREVADRFVRGWSLDVKLRSSGDALEFEYTTADVIDRDPPPPGTHVLHVHSTSHVHIVDNVTLHVVRRSYPAPPEDFEYTTDVEILEKRLDAYYEGREPLLSMAYFFLTWLEKRMVQGRANAAREFNVDKRVLDRLGELTSERGDSASARKAGPALRPLSEREATWILAGVKALLRNIASRGALLSRVTLDDLPLV